MLKPVGALSLSLLLASCAGETGGPGDGEGGDPGDRVTGDLGDVGEVGSLTEADEGVTDEQTIVASLGAGEYARVCNATALNQRSGPGTSYSILRSMPEGTTTKILEQQSGWYKNDWGGRIGWSSGTYLCPVTGGGGGGDTGLPPPSFEVSGVSRDNFLAVAQAAVGFSYWWGGGRFATGASHGACYGSCPSCDHSGSYGADCSGFIGKVWLLSASMPMDSNKHPYTTADFYSGSQVWGDVSRSNVLRGDALVYRSSGSGHVLLYEKGDPWGSVWTFEARGCSYGVVHNLRTSLSTSYKGIRRDGL